MKGSKFKRIIMVGMMVASTAVNTLAGNIPKVNLNGDKVLLQQSPFIENGRTYIPLRAVSENMGATVKWDGSSQTITINNEKTTVVCQIGNNVAHVNKDEVKLDAPPKLKYGSTYVPLRFTADCLGAEVKYDKASNTIDIAYQVPEKYGVKYVDGRAVRTTNLPKNAKDFSYILEGVPNEMYEIKAEYQYKNNAVEGKNYIRPVNIETDSFYSEENVQKWKEIIEKNLDLKFNIDYKTIDSKWAKEMTSTYIACQKIGEGNYEKYLKYTSDYVKYVKDNKLQIEGDFYVEPSICYNSDGAIYMRAWVKFTIKDSKDGKAELFENRANKLNESRTYEGYVDIALGTNNGNSRGQDLGILKDNVSGKPSIKEKKEVNVELKTYNSNLNVNNQRMANDKEVITCRD